MYVRNIAGYNFAFKYRDAVIYIPFDGKLYSIPDDSGVYRELKIILAMHIRTQDVTYINKDGSVASDKISGHKRRGRPLKQVDPKKPLKGLKLKRDVPKNVEPKVEPIDDNSIMDIDLDVALDTPKVEELPIEKVIPKKTPAKKKTTGKNRGRPRKKTQ